jgi:hypothetical protein
MGVFSLRRAKERQRLPRARNMVSDPLPTELKSPVRAAHAEEARRVALRHLEQEAAIDALTEEVTAWRNRALAAEAQMEMLIDREQRLLAMIDKEKATSLRKQEHYLETLAVVRTHFSTVSQLLLEGFKAINSAAGSPTEVDIDVDVLEETLQKDDPLPSIVTQCPRTN